MSNLTGQETGMFLISRMNYVVRYNVIMVQNSCVNHVAVFHSGKLFMQVM